MREDLHVWWQLLAPGGLLLGDDFVRGWAGVVRAACEFAVEQGVELHSGDEFEDGNRVHRRSWQTKWWIFKPSGRPRRHRPTPRNATWLRRCQQRVPDFARPNFES